MKRKQKYIVENRYNMHDNNLVGIFKSMEEAKAYVEKEVACVREEYTHEPEAKSGIPQTDFLEDSWVEDDRYVLDLYDNFEYKQKTFVWKIHVLQRKEN